MSRGLASETFPYKPLQCGKIKCTCWKSIAISILDTSTSAQAVLTSCDNCDSSSASYTDVTGDTAAPTGRSLTTPLQHFTGVALPAPRPHRLAGYVVVYGIGDAAQAALTESLCSHRVALDEIIARTPAFQLVPFLKYNVKVGSGKVTERKCCISVV